MYTLDMGNLELLFKNIKTQDLSRVHKWYNNAGEFKYATGTDFPVTLEYLKLKFTEAVISRSEFFSGIYHRKSSTMIGLVRGSYRKEQSMVWLNSMLIAPFYRRQGYGTRAFAMLQDHIKANTSAENIFLTVMEQNVPGINFWIKQGFSLSRIVVKKNGDNSSKSVIMIKYLSSIA